MGRLDTVLFDWPHLLFVIGINRNASNSHTPAKLTFRAYPNNRLVMRPSENLSAYGGVPPLGVLRKSACPLGDALRWGRLTAESLGLRRGQGGRSKMPGRRQASLARRGLLHVDPVRDPPLEVRRQLLTGDTTEKASNGVENVFSPTTQPSGLPWG